MYESDARKLAVNAMVRVLGRANLSVPVAIKSEMLYALQKYNVIRVEPTKGDMQKQIKYYLDTRAVDGLSPNTLKIYRYQLQAFAGHVDHYPERINTDSLRNYLSYLSNERHFKTSSIVSVINILRTFFGWMQSEEIIKKNPMDKIKTLKFDKKSLRHYLSVEEVELLRSGCVTEREKAMFELLYSSGCRVAEVAGINISDINFYERSVRVIGKGSKEREVYFSVRAKLCIESYLRNRKGGCDALFVGYIKPCKRLTMRSVEKEIQRIGTRTAVKARVFPHLLRHYGECLQMGSVTEKSFKRAIRTVNTHHFITRRRAS